MCRDCGMGMNPTNVFVEFRRLSDSWLVDECITMVRYEVDQRS